MREAAMQVSSEDVLQALTFNMAGETFALEAGVVREILDLQPETDIPGAPAFVGAVINFRGRVIPLVDLRLAFGLQQAETTPDSRIIVIEFPVDGAPTLVGLRADKVYEVTTIDASSTEAPPSVGMRWRADFIQSFAKRDGDVIVIPDLARIFATRGRAASVTPLNPSQS
jgi:purine-binding chemotaxis protein CheW